MDKLNFKVWFESKEEKKNKIKQSGKTGKAVSYQKI